MFFKSKKSINLLRRPELAAILLITLCAAVFAGCSIAGKTTEPEGASVTASGTTTEEKSNYSKYTAGVVPVEGNVNKFQLGPIDDREAPEAVVSGKYVYFLSRVSENYQMVKINIEDPADSGIATLEGDEGCFCLLYDYGVRVEKKDEVVFMDLELNVISTVQNEEVFEHFVPYKDTYLVLQGDDLSILKDGRLEPFRKLNRPVYTVLHQQIMGDNTRLLLNDNNAEGEFNFFIYDVNADKYENVSEMGFNYFTDGFYDINPKRVLTRSFSEESGREFENKYPGTIGTSFFDGQRLYLCDEGDLTIRYYDPSHQAICTLSEHEFSKYGVNFRGLSGSKLFFILSSELYVVDTSNCEEMPIEEYKIVLHGKIIDLETEIRDKYSVNFLEGERAAKHIRDNIETTAVKEETRVYYTMKKIAAYIRRFGRDFFEEFRYGTSKGVYVLLTGYTQVTNDGAKIDAGGVAFRQGDIFYIILNINNEDPARNFCHEIMHTMEQNSDSDTFFPEWKKYNPKGFKYADSYAKGTDDKYTIYDSDENDKYFYDSYSKTNAMEDRARVFENLLAPSREECSINQYPRLKAKAHYIKERIYKLYPSLKDTDIFENLDE